MSDEPLILLNPGPANTSERVRRALTRGDLCHREPEFDDLARRICLGLTHGLQLADTHQALLVTGSGTAAMEMAVISSVRAGRAVLVVDNGVYGDRLYRIALAHGITSYRVSGRWDRPIDPAAVRRALADHPDVDAVACVFHETTTGLVNPVAEVGAVVEESDAVFVVDAISAVGIEEPGLPTLRADLICGSANKGLHGLPGIAFLLLSHAKGLPRIRQVPTRSVYLDAAAYRPGESAAVPFTPAIQVCYAFDEAIAEFIERGGYPARVAEYRARAARLRAGFAALRLNVLVAEQYRGNSVTTLALPAGVCYEALHDRLKIRGFVIYRGQGPLATSHFRVSNMGELTPAILDRFVGELGEALASVRSTAG
jgi:2-aminoethylphosphonate-pyruvate transaminase